MKCRTDTITLHLHAIRLSTVVVCLIGGLCVEATAAETSKEQTTSWQKSYKDFAKVVKSKKDPTGDRTIEWEAKFAGLVDESERFFFDGVVVSGNITVQIRDQFPKGVKFDLPSFFIDGSKVDLWFQSTDADLDAWKKIPTGTLVRFSGLLTNPVGIRNKVNENGTTVSTSLDAVFWFKDVKLLNNSTKETVKRTSDARWDLISNNPRIEDVQAILAEITNVRILVIEYQLVARLISGVLRCTFFK